MVPVGHGSGLCWNPHASVCVLSHARFPQLLSSVNSSTVSDDAQNASGSVALGSCMDSECMIGNSIAGASHGPKDDSVEWKYTTLLRLRKFLRRQYRSRKNKVVDSVSNTGSSGQDIADERDQLQQLAADIKSIEFEIRLLSDSQTAVKQHADVCVEYDEAGSVEPKDRSLQSDSARSRRDTVNRLLKSAGSLGGSSASRMGGLSSGERLARLHEGDEGDTAGEEKAEGDLRGVRRNLLELYADPQQDAPATAAGSASMESQADAKALRSTGLPAGNRSNLQSVDMCIEAIRSMGAKARAAEGSSTLQRADDTASMSEEVAEERGGAGPCKIARLARQLDMDDCVERENDSSPSKIERLIRQMATVVNDCSCCSLFSDASLHPAARMPTLRKPEALTDAEAVQQTTQSATPQEPEPSAGPEPVAPVRLFASSVEHENDSSPSKIDRQRRQNASVGDYCMLHFDSEFHFTLRVLSTRASFAGSGLGCCLMFCSFRTRLNLILMPYTRKQQTRWHSNRRLHAWARSMQCQCVCLAAS